MANKQELRQVRDYEILGVGALRRELILAAKNEFELLTHPALVPAGQSEMYEGLLRETVAWLKPREVRPVKPPQSAKDFLLEALLEELRREFPQTTAYLKGGLREILADYMKEVPWQGPLLTAHFRYLPVFLKRKFKDTHLYLIAQKEWLWSFLSFADFGFPPAESGRLLANPSMQSLFTDEEIPEVQLTPGLTVFFYNDSKKKLCEYKMDLWDAAIIDALQEDRKLNLSQLLDQLQLMDLETPLAKEEWARKISNLQNEGAVLVL